MQIERIEDSLGDLSLVPLRCLSPDRETYGAMLLQPDGPIEGSTTRVGHHNRERGLSLCRAFLQKSVESGTDLVVAPEYCVPWGLAREIGSNNSRLRPAEGAIWVLGFESIVPAELTIVTDYLREQGHFAHHEDIANSQLTYLDPLLYVFWCLKPDNSRTLCFVVQFKTCVSRDGLDIEQRSLILGKRVYTFNRAIDQIGLMTIICSDAFAFTDTLVDGNHSNMLLIHIQLNQKPAHLDYKRYRERLFSVASKNNVELMCLNWAGNLVEIKDEKEKQWENNAGSAFYVPPGKFKAHDRLLNDLHKAGVYYSTVNRWHAMYLNQSPHAILLQKQKVMMQGAPVALTPTTWMTVNQRWTWSTSGEALVDAMSASDGFGNVIETYTDIAHQLTAYSLNSPIDVERALEMLSGALKKSEGWFQVENLECMQVEVDELLKRITVHQDFERGSKGILFRKQRLQRAQNAITLPGHGVPWPHPLADLEQGFIYLWTPDEPYKNIQATANNSRACLIYLGEQLDDDVIDNLSAILREGLSIEAVTTAVRQHRDPTDALARCCDRLCIVYIKNHQYCVWGKGRLNRIDRPLGQSAFDISGEGA